MSILKEEKPKFTPDEVFDEAQRLTFRCSDALALELLHSYKTRLSRAANTIGREWNETFNDGHILTFAFAYEKLRRAALQELVEADDIPKEG